MSSEIDELKKRNEQLQRENEALRRLVNSRRFRAADRLGNLYNQVLPIETKRREVVNSTMRGVRKIAHGRKDRWVKENAAQVAKLAAGHDRVIVIDSIAYHTKIKQRPHHLAQSFADLGYLVIYLEPTNLTCSYRKITDNIITINSHKYLSRIRAKHRYFLLPNTMSMPFSDLKQVLGWGYRLIYDYIDDFHEDISGDLTAQREIWEQLPKLNPAVCSVTAKQLQKEITEHLKTKSCPIVMAPNGVIIEHFDYRTQNDDEPKDLKPIIQKNHPIVGFYGALAPWIDFDLIHQVAVNHPEWEIVLVGMDYDGALAELKPADNIHCLGAKPYDKLVDYAKHFDCAIIPFKNGEIAKATSPVKLFEYMATGLPTVCTRDLQECRGYDYVYLAKDNADFENKLQQAILDHDNPDCRARLVEQAAENTWPQRATAIDEALRSTEK